MGDLWQAGAMTTRLRDIGGRGAPASPPCHPDTFGKHDWRDLQQLIVDMVVPLASARCLAGGSVYLHKNSVFYSVGQNKLA